MRLVVAALAVMAVAACGPRSMLGADLDKQLGELDTSIERGDVEVACSRVPDVMRRIGEWAEGVRGNKSGPVHQTVERLGDVALRCGVGGGVTTVKADELQAAWRPPYQELRKLSTQETSWLTLFTYVSMIAVGIGAYLFLRRVRPST
jgi:hypothetical protein